MISRISVRLGEWDLNSETDCQNQMCSDAVLDVPINEVILHGDYRVDAVSHAHDIALVFLDHSVTPTKWIRPICLPVKNIMDNYDNIDMNVAGWGHTSSLPNGKPINIIYMYLRYFSKFIFELIFFVISAQASGKKMQVTLKGVPQKKCDKMYKRFNVSINEKQLCAGGEEGFDSCRG